MSLGNNIKKIREIKNISIDEMVRRLGIFKSIYLNIENSVIIPNSTLIKKIANIFSLNENDIIDFREDKINRIVKDLNLKNLKDIALPQSKSKSVDSIIKTPITGTPINVVFEDLSVKDILSKKSRLITSAQLFQIGDNNKKVGFIESLSSDIIIDSSGQLVTKEEKETTISSRILNWIEPFNINGINKTLFFTELNTGFKVGDRVFIINGSYDSNNLIINRRYKRGNDGYRVLFIDKCKLVLDIDYSATKPYEEQDPDNLLNIHLISDRADLRQAARHLITKGNELNKKFANGKGNIAFISLKNNGDYIAGPKPGESGWGLFREIGDAPGFYVYNNNIGGTPSWSNITNNFESGTFQNSKIRIVNGDINWTITYSNSEKIDFNFKEGFIYKWGEIKKEGLTYSGWVPDSLYQVPIITKSNFRFGKFKGVFNSGLFGSIDRVATWNNATWNNGFMFNSNWNSGKMSSSLNKETNFISDFDGETPYQKLGTPNNDGFQFNYIIESVVNSGIIDNGNFINSKIGNSLSSSVVESKLLSLNDNFSVVVNKARFRSSKIEGSKVLNSEFKNTRLSNSRVSDSKSINSEFKSSVLENSVYLSIEDIKILAYDEYSIAEKSYISGSSHKIYKFYISKNDWLKLKNKDTIYIKNLIIKDKSKYPISFFDRKFRISTWFEYFDSYDLNKKEFRKLGIEIGVFLSTPDDNTWKINWISNPKISVITEQNLNKQYSVDVVISTTSADRVPTNGGTSSNVVSTYKIKEFPLNGMNINKDGGSSERGKQDGSFVVGAGFSSPQVNVVRLNNGKILVGGNFTSYNGISANKIIRLNNDGSVDTTFVTGTGFGNIDGQEVFDIQIDNNDKILVGGNFLGYNGVPSRCLIRLNQDGSIDETFNLDMFRFGAVAKVRSIQVDVNNRILVGGVFNRYNSTLIITPLNPRFPVSGPNILRLNEDLTIDTNFMNEIISDGRGFELVNNESVRIIKIQNNGKILVGGDFTYRNSDRCLIRLESDGKTDTELPSAITSSWRSVKTIDIQTDGKILVGGNLGNDGYIVRLELITPNLSLDTAFINNLPNILKPGSSIDSINKIIVNNNNNEIYVLNVVDRKPLPDPTTTNTVALDINGSQSQTLNINRFNLLNNETNDIAIDEFNRLYIVGNFTTYNNLSYRGIVRVVSLFSEPETLGDNIDITNAYIINSEFDGGIIDGVNWISGDHINYSNDLNFVYNNVNFGTYSIIAITQSSELSIETNYNSNNPERVEIEKGDIIFLNGVEFTSNNGFVTKLGDSYKVVDIFNDNNNINPRVLVKEIGTDIISSFTQSGTFSTINAQNRYNYIHKTKIQNSKIFSGLFRRAYIKSSVISNDNLNISDKNFSDLLNLKNLTISDSIFKNNSNNLSKALYMNSSFVEGDDNFLNGIVFNSIWNGMEFNNGLFKESRWVNGNFKGGLFYNNRSFNLSPTPNNPLIGLEIELSYYKDGVATESNDRYSWQNGELTGGDFVESDWEMGEIKSGRFYYSNFHGGTISGGTLGDKSIPTSYTKILNAYIESTLVDNASIIASENYTGNISVIDWKNGRFNAGIFGSENHNIAIWENGVFNGGEFRSMGIWKDGVFNGGDFISVYGWSMSNSMTQSDYTWQNGEFNSGNFGNSSTSENSTWYTGQFNGGKFKGRVWNDGVFVNGEFIGSATYSATGEVTATSSNASLFKNSFNNRYYGLWRSGFVTNKVDNLINKLSISLKANASIKDALWLSGTFSHSSGEFKNSVWLTGSFQNGEFVESSFNPYVSRNGTYSFDLTDNTIWINGVLKNSDFYISKWKRGLFDRGNAWGMKWENGLSNYMNAFNIFWDAGIWKNGNWNGSYMDYLGSMSSINDDFNKKILQRGISFSATQSMHIWNLFDISSSTASYNSLNNSEMLFTENDIIPIDPNNNLANVSYTASISGEIVTTKIGNGYFKSGVWQNGVWNSGIREDNTIEDFMEVVNYVYAPFERLWRVEIKKGLTHSFKIGDDVSIGNIIAIDINENRRFLKDSYKVILTTEETITVEVKTSFAIRRIEKDSENHVIKVTKNTWLSGAFLNGIFRNGIWNFGIFNGYPKITKMVDTNWIDGVFNGGHFSATFSNIDSKTFSTGVMQNVKLNTYNISEGIATQSSTASYVYKYNSWIDVNYSTMSATNIGRKETKINPTSNRSYSENSFHGYITNDVLSSKTKFRDTFSLDEFEYNLGNKWKIYGDFIGDSSQFSRSFTQPSINIFLSDGWTFSSTSPNLNIRTSPEGVILLSYNQNFVLDISKPFELSDFNGIVRNRDTNRILSNRYSFIEFDLGGDPGLAAVQNDSINFDNVNTSLNYLPIKNNVNHLRTPVIKKVEFFYNKINLSLNLVPRINTGVIRLSNIKFYEVDMIPFFQYFNDSVINSDIQIPLSGRSPYLPYNEFSNIDFFFIDNNNIGIDSKVFFE